MLKKSYKNILTILISALVFLSSASNVVAFAYIKSATNNSSAGLSKMYDLQDALTDSEEKQLNELIDKAVKKTEFNIAVIITDDIGTKNPMEFADDFYIEKFKKDTDGILLLINNDTKYDQISTSGACIKYFNDKRIDKVLNNVSPKIKNDDYYNASKIFCQQVEKYYSQGVPSKQYSSDTDDEQTSPLVIILSAAGACILIFVIFVLVIKSRYKNKKQYSTTNYLNKNSVTYTRKEDVFVKQYTHKRKIDTSSGGSGGSGGGRSSTHTSSGGGTHGGGGRGR